MGYQYKNIVLASGSPRRLQLLRDAGFSVSVVPPRLDESVLAGESGEDAAMRLARSKAELAAPRCPAAVIIGADTVVVHDGHILGKPASLDEARSMLQRLSGRAHWVITGVCILATDRAGRVDNRVSWSCRTQVVFKHLDRPFIDEYLAAVHPLDKAGGYAIQDRGDSLVKDLTGWRSNVIGLPIEEVCQRLSGFGLSNLNQVNN